MRFGVLLIGLLGGLALNQLLSRRLPQQRTVRERDKLDLSKLFDRADQCESGAGRDCGGFIHRWVSSFRLTAA